MDHIRNGGGLNGSFKLTTESPASVQADKGGNFLNGGYDADWFFKRASDTTKQGTGEVIDAI